MFQCAASVFQEFLLLCATKGYHFGDEQRRKKNWKHYHCSRFGVCVCDVYTVHTHVERHTDVKYYTVWVSECVRWRVCLLRCRTVNQITINNKNFKHIDKFSGARGRMLAHTRTHKSQFISIVFRVRALARSCVYVWLWFPGESRRRKSIILRHLTQQHLQIYSRSIQLYCLLSNKHYYQHSIIFYQRFYGRVWVPCSLLPVIPIGGNGILRFSSSIERWTTVG